MFGLSTIAAKAIGATIACALIAAALYGLYRHVYEKGHAAGVAERNAYYEPLFEAAKEGLAAETARTQEHDAAAAAIVNDLKARYDQETAALAARAASADERIARILRDNAAHPTAGGGAVPGVPGSPDARAAAGEGHDAAPPGGPRSRLALDAAACEHDADEVIIWLEWYNRQRQLFDTNSAK